ncbi:MAG: tetratricopeptide repeat protein [Desulfobaccales bacterium]
MKKAWWIAAGLLVLAVGLMPVWAEAKNQAQKLVEQRTALMEKQQFDEALATFQKALKEEPNSAVIYNLMGMAYRFKYNQVRNQKLRQQEIAAFQKAIEVDPNFWVALINLGVTYYQSGNKTKAAPLLKKALSLKPDHPEKAQFEKMIQEGGEKP